MIAKASILYSSVQIIDEGYCYDYLSVDEARQLAHELICAAEKVDGNSCIIACFTRQGDCLPADKEIICKKIEELVDTTGEIDGVVVFKQKEVA